MTQLDIRQLADKGGTNPIAPLTVPEAVVFSDGDNLKDVIGTTDISNIGNGSITGAINVLETRPIYTTIGSKSSISGATTISLNDSIENYKTICVMVRTSGTYSGRSGNVFIPVIDILEGGYGSSGYNYFAGAYYLTASPVYTAELQFYFSNKNTITITGVNIRGWSGGLTAKVYGIN